MNTIKYENLSKENRKLFRKVIKQHDKSILKEGNKIYVKYSNGFTRFILETNGKLFIISDKFKSKLTFIGSLEEASEIDFTSLLEPKQPKVKDEEDTLSKEVFEIVFDFTNGFQLQVEHIEDKLFNFTLIGRNDEVRAEFKEFKVDGSSRNTFDLVERGFYSEGWVINRLRSNYIQSLNKETLEDLFKIFYHFYKLSITDF